MKLLISFPDKILFSEYYYNFNIVFLDESGWFIYDDKKNTRQWHPIGFSKKKSFVSINPEGLRELLNWWSPIWTRWVSNSFNYELYRINALEIIDDIVHDLNELKIRYSIINTGVPHHIDSSLLQISLSYSNISQIFLYSIVLDGRLIPLVQSKSIFDRNILSLKLTNLNYDPILLEFINNKIDGKTPKINTKITKVKKSFYFSLFLLFIEYSKKTLLKISNFNSKQKENWTKFYNEISFFESFKLLLYQKKYLNHYDSCKLSITDTYNFINEGKIKLIITAHFQPEATSFPEGGRYSNHIEIIMKIRSLGYEDIIGYKEHPATWMYRDKVVGITRVGIYRSKKYLDHLLNLGCLMLDEKYNLPINGYNSNKYVPVTISGSIAIERSLLGLHTIVAGEPWYKGLPGIITLNELSMLKSIPDEWVSYSPEIKQQAKEFLLSKLNNSTLNNTIGIGTGIKIENEIEVKQFKDEFDNLLNNIITS